MYAPPKFIDWTSSYTSVISTSRHLQRTMVSPHTILQILFVVALISSTDGFIGSEDEQATHLNNELLLRNQPASNSKSRLATLLELSQSIKALMDQRDDIIPQNANDVEDGGTLDDSDREIVTQKRVFCNGFTGCGGRFRGRLVKQQALEDMKKRMEKAAASKRPFCNTNGCFNGGKRKKDKAETYSRGLDGMPYFVNSDKLRDGSSSNSYSIDRPGSNLRDKRIFCNGYGGCQNMIKRGTLLPLLAGNRQPLDETYLVEKPAESVFEITLEPNKKKRFFASSYDEKMAQLKAKIGR